MRDFLNSAGEAALALALVVGFTYGNVARAGIPDNGLPDNGIPDNGLPDNGLGRGGSSHDAASLTMSARPCRR